MHAGMTNDYQLPTANLVYDNPGSDLERLIPNSKCQMAEPEFSLPETCNIYDFVNESDCGCDPFVKSNVGRAMNLWFSSAIRAEAASSHMPVPVQAVLT